MGEVHKMLKKSQSSWAFTKWNVHCFGSWQTRPQQTKWVYICYIVHLLIMQFVLSKSPPLPCSSLEPFHFFSPLSFCLPFFFFSPTMSSSFTLSGKLLSNSLSTITVANWLMCLCYQELPLTHKSLSLFSLLSLSRVVSREDCHLRITENTLLSLMPCAWLICCPSSLLLSLMKFSFLFSSHLFIFSFLCCFSALSSLYFHVIFFIFVFNQLSYSSPLFSPLFCQ